MQFTVLIEFLIPGLATVFLVLALVPPGCLPTLPSGIPVGDNVTMLLLLAVAYPVGILSNFPLYLVQSNFITPRIRRKILAEYHLDVEAQRSAGVSQHPKKLSAKQLRNFFDLLRVRVFRETCPWLDTRYQFYQSLQRLARGVLIPLLLAVLWVYLRRGLSWEASVGLLLAVAGLALCAVWLLVHSVRREDEYIVRFYQQRVLWRGRAR